ncbi:MAG: DUF6516 family protein [Chitinophagales bacterium]
MMELLRKFPLIISSFEIIETEARGGAIKKVVRIEIVDGSILFVKEVSVGDEIVDYSYHWQKNDTTLIVRWDTSPYHPKISTHPFHKHMYSKKEVEPSEEMTLEKVLAHISSVLSH